MITTASAQDWADFWYNSTDTNTQTMSTRSRIGYQLKDGSIVSVYHHFDGYPDGLGKYLVNNYTDVDDVRELIDGGDMSTCMTDNGEPEYYAIKGDRNVDPELSMNEDAYHKLTDDVTGEYAYTFVNGSWTCYDVGNRKYVALYEVAA